MLKVEQSPLKMVCLEKQHILMAILGCFLPKGLISSNQYTVSLWLKPEELTAFTTTFFGARTTDSWISFVPSGPVNDQTMLWSGTQWFDAPTGLQIKANEWTHVAFTVDKGKVDVYIDGVNKFTSTGFPNVFTTDDAVFALGVNYWDTPYKGFMDELLVYENMVLTEEEIQEYSELISLNFYTKELEELVQKAKGISNVDNLYTTDSLSSLSVAIEEAENALLSLDSVEGLKGAISALQKGLEDLKVDVSDLETLIVRAKEIDNAEGLYTETSYEALQTAITEAEKALPTIDNLESRTAAVSDLREALNNLTVDVSDL